MSHASPSPPWAVQDARFHPDELEGVLGRARAAGVFRIAVNGCHVGDWQRVDAIAAAHGDLVVANYGLHPWWVGRQQDDWLVLLRQRLLANPGAGLGEVGRTEFLNVRAGPIVHGVHSDVGDASDP